MDAEALEQACRWTLESHGVLRTSFHWQELDRPLQVVHGHPEVVLERQDWRGLPAERRLEELQSADRQRGFDLSRAPLMRWTLARTGETEHWLLWSQHHLLLDGWSLSAVTGSLLEAYRALRSGREPRAERRRPYRDYIAWLESRDLSETESFWRRTLAGWTEPTPLPESPTRQTGRGRRDLRLSADASARLQAQARAHQLTLNTLVQAAWGLLLGRMAGVDDAVFGATVSGRPAELPGVETMVGLFINTLPVRLRLDSSALLPWLRELLSSQAELRQHEHSPLVKVQAWSEVPRGRALFESILVFENYPIDAAMREAGGGENGLGIVEVLSREQTNYPMTLDVSPAAELMLALNFDRSRFDDASVIRMLGHLESLLSGMAKALEAGGEVSLSALPLLKEAERHQLLLDWNDTARDLSREPVHERFARQASRIPEAVALSFGKEVLSYSELDRRSNQVAQALRKRGVAPGAIVGLNLERSLEMVVGLLGIWKAGGAYLPLDPSYPPERLSFLREDAGAEVVLTQEILAEEESDEVLAVASDLAYVIYTSGSTGRPKGVLVGHAQLAHTLSASLSEMGWNGSDRIACLAPFSFDIFLFELLSPLLSGGRCDLVSISPGPDMERLSELLPDLTRLHAVPALMRQIVESVETPCPKMRTLFVGGEAVPADLLSRMREVFPEAELRVLYGPTEATIIATSWRAEPAGSSIGRPLPNVEIRVVDRDGHPSPIGASGEIWIGGPGVALGYLGRPELTAERFVERDGRRFYRTGDLARWSASGDLEFLGRGDGQVKLRGFRIELGEIESLLREADGVRDAAAGLVGNRLVAWVVPDRPGLDPRPFLQERLPSYMVPSAIVELESLPLTAHGKLDRRALPDPERGGTARFEAPRTETERRLAEIWAELLKLARVGVQDDFFELGGDSLLSMRLVAAVKQRLGRSLPLAALFETRTVERLALRLEEAGSRPWSPLVPIQPLQTPGSKPPFFCVHPMGGGVQAYLPLAKHLGPEQPFYGLEAGESVSALEEMASSYVAALRTVQPTGPYRLGGWSLGGLIAFEMARQIEAAGEQVVAVLIDPTPPGGPPDQPRGSARSVVTLAAALAFERGLAWTLHPDEVEALSAEARLERVLAELRRLGIAGEEIDLSILARHLEGCESRIEAARAYRPQPCASPILLVRPEEWSGIDPKKGWRRLAKGGLRVERVPGHHGTMVQEPNVRELARLIAEYLGEIG
ncbi:MAG: amino acid adenylation domain-containing protein [Acidobacteriota bacterium]